MKKLNFHKGSIFITNLRGGGESTVPDGERYETHWRLLCKTRSMLSHLHDDMKGGIEGEEIEDATASLHALEHSLKNTMIGNSGYSLDDVEWSSHHEGEEK